jgi:3-isopropylmalate dehydrogenase
MEKNIAILPGDGIGTEVIRQAVKVLKSIESLFDHKFTYTNGLVGGAAIDETGNPFPEATEKLCREADAILFGAIGDPRYDHDPAIKARPEQGLLKMRSTLGLYANIRPVSNYKGLEHMSPLKNDRLKNVDMVVFRELTGGIYYGNPSGRSEDGLTAFDTCVYSKFEIERIARLAFEKAMDRNRKVTLVDKANVLATSRLWRETVREVARQYPNVELDFMFVDNAAMKVIQQPSYFDVVLTENLFGDILTDEVSVLAGSLGMLPSASVGDRYKLFEPVHGSYPQMAGKNKANPIGAILSAALLLEIAFDARKEAFVIRKAVEETLTEGFGTEDINPESPSTTEDFGNKVVENMSMDQMINFSPLTII